MDEDKDKEKETKDGRILWLRNRLMGGQDGLI